MHSGALLLAFGALILGTVPARAQHFEYAPGTVQYRLTLHSGGITDQGGTKQDVSYDTEQRMTLTLARQEGDTLGLTITVDSVSGTLPNGAPMRASSTPGAPPWLKVDAAVSPAGRLYARRGVTGPGAKSVGDFADELYRFLPAVPPALGVGVTWSDTVSTPISQMGTELERSVVTTYRVLGDTSVDGESAWRIGRTVSVEVNGTGTALGQSIRFDTNGKGSGMLYLSRAGRYLGADYRDDILSKATLAPGGITITSTQTQVTKIALVR